MRRAPSLFRTMRRAPTLDNTSRAKVSDTMPLGAFSKISAAV